MIYKLTGVSGCKIYPRFNPYPGATALCQKTKMRVVRQANRKREARIGIPGLSKAGGYDLRRTAFLVLLHIVTFKRQRE